MTWGAVAVAVGTVAVGAINADKSAKSAQDVAETPTRFTGIEQLLRELTSTSNEQTNSTETQNAIDSLLSNEEFLEAFQKEMATNEVFAQQVATQQENLQTTERGTVQSQEALDALISGSGGAQGQVDALVNKILREGKADISNVGSRTGSFGSTTEQLLSNDLITKAAEAGVGLQLQQDANQLEAIKAAQAGTETSTGVLSALEDTTGETTGTTTETGESTGQTTTEQDRTTESTTALDSETATTTASTEESTAVSDSLTDPRDNVGVTGALADLVDVGIDPEGVTSVADIPVGPTPSATQPPATGDRTSPIRVSTTAQQATVAPERKAIASDLVDDTPIRVGDAELGTDLENVLTNI